MGVAAIAAISYSGPGRTGCQEAALKLCQACLRVAQQVSQVAGKPWWFPCVGYGQMLHLFPEFCNKHRRKRFQASCHSQHDIIGVTGSLALLCGHR